MSMVASFVTPITLSGGGGTTASTTVGGSTAPVSDDAAESRGRELQETLFRRLLEDQQDALDQARADVTGQAARVLTATQPVRELGAGAVERLTQLFGLDGSGTVTLDAEVLESLPGYRFQRDQGLRAIENSAAARGGALSGRALAEATRFNQELAASSLGGHIESLQQLAQWGSDPDLLLPDLGETLAGVESARAQSGTTLGTAQAAALWDTYQPRALAEAENWLSAQQAARQSAYAIGNAESPSADDRFWDDANSLLDLGLELMALF
ncbi:MAG: hypothetical protein H7831_04555 [Magnetococcus sp. WYHC-3]